MTLQRSKSLLITLGFLILAVACYAIGLTVPGAAFFIVGAAAEIVFWVRVSRRRR
jgi:hypothetical protein